MTVVSTRPTPGRAATPPARVEAGRPAVLDDRWPDRFGAGMGFFGVFVALITLIPPARRYFARQYDVLSLLFIPIVPGLVYAALLLVMAVALRRRLRAAWWLLVVWWLVLPELGRLLWLVTAVIGYANPTLVTLDPSLRITEPSAFVLQVIGFLLMGAVLVIALRARPQFSARRVPGNVPAALAVFFGGGIVVLILGTALTMRFGATNDTAAAIGHVLNAMFVELGRFAPSDNIRPRSPSAS